MFLKQERPETDVLVINKYIIPGCEGKIIFSRIQEITKNNYKLQADTNTKFLTLCPAIKKDFFCGFPDY